MKDLIVKLQMPISTNSPTPAALVYAEGHKHQRLVDITPEIKKVMEGKDKAYFKATLDGLNVKIHLDQPVEAQLW